MMPQQNKTKNNKNVGPADVSCYVGGNSPWPTSQKKKKKESVTQTLFAFPERVYVPSSCSVSQSTSGERVSSFFLSPKNNTAVIHFCPRVISWDESPWELWQLPLFGFLPGQRAFPQGKCHSSNAAAGTQPRAEWTICGAIGFLPHSVCWTENTYFHRTSPQAVLLRGVLSGWDWNSWCPWAGLPDKAAPSKNPFSYKYLNKTGIQKRKDLCHLWEYRGDSYGHRACLTLQSSTISHSPHLVGLTAISF